MQLTPAQEEVIRNKARFKVLNWGRRSGKTTVFGYEALGTALSINNSHTTYYAQTFDDARSIAWDIFTQIFDKAIKKRNESRLEFTLSNIHGGSSHVSLKGWESVYQHGKGRGTENDLLLCDEVAFCRGFLPVFEKVLEPTLLTTKGRAVFGSTPNGFNDFYTLSNMAQSQPLWWYSHATSYDNPFNDPHELNRIQSTKTADAWAQEYMADFRRQEGLVYKEFDRNKHIFDDNTELPRFIETIGGVDFGFRNPCAVLTIKVDFDGRFWVMREWYKIEKTDADIAEYAAAQHFNITYPDPENQAGIEELKRNAVNVREVNKGPDSVVNGINKVREMFKQGRLFIHQNCTNLISELESYHYDEESLDINQKERPIKYNDHALDALRYVIMMHVASVEPLSQDYSIYSHDFA